MLQPGLEEAQALGVEGGHVGGVVGRPRVAEVAELQRHGRALGLLAQQVVDAQALADGEEVVGPAGLDEQRRDPLVDRQPEHAVVGVDLLEDRADVRAVGLALGQPLVPGCEVGAGVGAEGGDEAARVGQGVERVDVGLDLDADRRRVRVEPEAPVGRQRVGQVGPRPARPGGRDVQRHAVGRLPGLGHAVGTADAIGQHGELHRGARAGGDPGHPELVGARHELVDELGQQPLDVARLVALVVEVDPPALAAGGARVGHAARAPEPAGGRQHDGVAVARELHRVVASRLRALEVQLGAAEAVQHRHGRERPVAGGGQPDVDVERDAVEARDARRVVGRRAEERAVARRARVPEGRRRRRRGGGHRHAEQRRAEQDS